MKLVRRFLALGMAVSLMVSFSACAKKEVKNEPAGAQPIQTAEATKAPEKVKEVELNVMMSFPQYMDQWETYCKQFEAKMEEKGIKVKVNLEMPSSDQYESVLQARISGDDAPDLYTLHSNNIAVYNKAGNLVDLTDQPLTGKIYENVKNTVSVDGKVMAVPIESQAWGVFYNKDIFDKCGLKAPDTLEDLKNVCKVLKENGCVPFMLAFQEQWVPQLMTALTIGGKTSGEAKDWLERMYQDQASYEEIKDIFDPIDIILQNGTERPMEEGSEAGSADFAGGKAAMYVQGTWAAQTIMSTNPDLKMGVFPLPVNQNKDCTLVNLSTSTTLGVYPDSKNLDIALEFANYVLDDKDSSTLFKACSFNPLATVHNYESSPWVAEASKYVEEGRAYQDLVLPSSVTDEQGKLLQEYCVGAVTKEDIIKKLDEAFKQANSFNQ